MKSTVPLKCLKCLDAFLTMSISGVLDNSGEEERLGWIHIISAMYRRPAFVAIEQNILFIWRKVGKSLGKREKKVETRWEKLENVYKNIWEMLGTVGIIVSWEKLKKVEKRWEKLEKVDK